MKKNMQNALVHGEGAGIEHPVEEPPMKITWGTLKNFDAQVSPHID